MKVETLNTRDFIIVKEAYSNNLKHIDVGIPRRKLTVITGVSGSGKSSLAFNTLFAEGQRRYIESLSSYSRHFLERAEKPKVQYIKGICPTIAISQNNLHHSSKSTIATMTEIYDYLKILYTRIGRIHSPISNREVKAYTKDDILQELLLIPKKKTLTILAPITIDKGNSREEIERIISRGFSKVLVKEKMYYIEDILDKKIPSDIHIIVESLTLPASIEEKDTLLFDVSDSISTAFNEGKSRCRIDISYDDGKQEKRYFSDALEMDGMKFETPTLSLFNFHNSHGVCRNCRGRGKVYGINEKNSSLMKIYLYKKGL